MSAHDETPMALLFDKQSLFLQPIYSRAMQELVDAGSGAIYQIGKVFRADPLDRRHQREFSLLQWCAPAWSLDQVMQDLTVLFGALFAGDVLPEVRSYAQAFRQRLDFDPTMLSVADLRLQARRLGLTMSLGDDRAAWLDLLFHHFIEPTLGIESPLYLSELDTESTDADQQRLGRSCLHIYMEGIKVGSVLRHMRPNELGLAANPCYSIILGLDRLLMIMMESRRICQVLSWQEG